MQDKKINAMRIFLFQHFKKDSVLINGEKLCGRRVYNSNKGKLDECHILILLFVYLKC